VFTAEVYGDGISQSVVLCILSYGTTQRKHHAVRVAWDTVDRYTTLLTVDFRD